VPSIPSTTTRDGCLQRLTALDEDEAHPKFFPPDVLHPPSHSSLWYRSSSTACTKMDALQLSTHIDALALKISQIEAPVWFISGGFKALFEDATIYANVVSSSPLTVAPIISELLSSTSPPTSLDFMSHLPQAPSTSVKKLWAVYGHRMSKHGCPDKIYVGTGNDARDGVCSGLQCYKGGRDLPRFVRLAFEDGYTITASGLLCWTDLPTPSLVPRLNARFELIEAVFTILLRGAYPAASDFYIEGFYLWKGQAVCWGHLCSHLSLTEHVRVDVDLTSQQLDEIAEARLQRRRELQLVGYYKDGAGAAKAAKARAAIIESEEHFCEPCKLPFQGDFALQSHYSSDSHKYVVKRGKKKPQTAAGIAAAKVKASGIHRCTPCNKTFASKSDKTRHIKKDKKHDAKVRAYATMHGSDSDASTVAPVQTSLLKYFGGGKGSE